MEFLSLVAQVDEKTLFLGGISQQQVPVVEGFVEVSLDLLGAFVVALNRLPP